MINVTLVKTQNHNGHYLSRNLIDIACKFGYKFRSETYFIQTDRHGECAKKFPSLFLVFERDKALVLFQTLEAIQESAGTASRVLIRNLN